MVRDHFLFLQDAFAHRSLEVKASVRLRLLHSARGKLGRWPRSDQIESGRPL